MKFKAAIAAILTLGLCPALAFAAEAGEGQGSWLRLLFFTINFSAFVFIVVFYAGPFVKRFFHDRASSIRETLTRLENEEHRAEEAAQQAAARQARLDSDKTALAEEMRAETAREIDRLRNGAQANAARIKRDAELTAAAIAEGAKRQMRAHLAEVATKLARKLLVENLESSDQGRLVEDFMQRLHREEAKP
ncbi:MAG TPA: ATP synthase F0 subunit B [Candidatus Binataceae bacterium]|nr:ATP synthase F0 subunit B [Candidatus Binataceae bacterium]